MTMKKCKINEKQCNNHDKSYNNYEKNNARTMNNYAMTDEKQCKANAITMKKQFNNYQTMQ